MTKDAENVVTLNEPVTEEPQVITEESLQDDGLSPEEIAMAKEQGMIQKPEKEEGEEEKKEAKKVEKKEPEDEQEPDEINVEELDSFEKVHALFESKPDDFRKLPKHVRALYHNSKGLYKKAKTAEQKRQEIEKTAQFQTLQEKGAKMKLEKVAEALKKEDLTVEELQEILGQSVEAPKEEKNDGKDDARKEELANQQAQYMQARLAEAEKLGKTEYEDFDDITARAIDYIYKTNDKGQILQGQDGQPLVKNRLYYKALNDALLSDDVTEMELVNLVVDISKLNPKEVKKKEVETNENVERIVKNASKKPSSASVGSGGGGRTKTYDELTPEDITNMDQTEFNKIPADIVKRLMQQVE
jgi:hypothetical protein